MKHGWDVSAAEHVSSCAPIAEGNLSARASPLENTWHAYSERSAAEGNLLLLPNQQARKTIVERANEKTDEEPYRLCNTADYAEIHEDLEFFRTGPAQNSAGLLSIPCGEVDRPTSVEGGQLLRRISPGCRNLKPIYRNSVLDPALAHGMMEYCPMLFMQ